MSASQEPIILELAHLPREQMGPFLVLGLDKDATREEIEAHWADRLRWARKQQISIPLEDINWAREKLNDPQHRLQADAATLNLDTCESLLRQLKQRYGGGGRPTGLLLELIDEEKPLADYNLSIEVPQPESVRAGLALPEVPQEFPGVALLLHQVACTALDPWNLEL